MIQNIIKSLRIIKRSLPKFLPLHQNSRTILNIWTWFRQPDKLDDINDFANEFGGLETVVIPKLDDNGDPELDDNGEEQTEEKEIFVYDERLMSIFFENIADLNDLYAFKQVEKELVFPEVKP